jgi:hypothetical protein
MTLHSESGRIAALYTRAALAGRRVDVRQGAARARRVCIPFYAAYVGVPEGPVAGLRSFAAEETEELDPDEPPPKPRPHPPPCSTD